jgi:hypothetical protein
MIRISLSYIFILSSRLDVLERLPKEDSKLNDLFIEIFGVQQALEEINSGLYAPYLRASFNYRVSLLNDIKSFFQPSFDPEKIIQGSQIISLSNQYSQCKAALLGELAVMDAYFVTQKGGFDTSSLLVWVENMFPRDLAAKVPEAVPDIKEGAKCLAYSLPTGAGFHVFRAVESVLRRYHASVTAGKSPPKMRNMGVYVKSLEKSGKGDPKVIAALGQMKDLHRNPVAHPEAILTEDEALAIFGIARSAMGPMLAALPVPDLTTSAPALAATSTP